MPTSLVSLNICGLSKLETNTWKREWILGHDIIALQETLHLPHSLGFEGFTVIDEPARLQKGNGPGRRSGGIALLFANTWLGTASVEVIYRDWFLVAARVLPAEGEPLLIVNVYTPLHCDDCPPHLDAVIKSRIDGITTQFPGDRTILCGDWNGDLFRLNPGYDRKFLKIDVALQALSFKRFPRTRRPYTFRQAASKSTIDYVYTRGLDVEREEVTKVYITNHRPLRVLFNDTVIPSTLHMEQGLGKAYPRSSRSLDNIEKEITGLSLMKDPFSGSPEEHYAELSNLFEKYLKRPPRRPRQQGWESKLSPADLAELEDLRTNVDDLEEEYERTDLPATLESLRISKIRLTRRTAALQRQVADSLIRVGL
jgi:hypothetical protein